jgi:hypothetical protein
MNPLLTLKTPIWTRQERYGVGGSHYRALGRHKRDRRARLQHRVLLSSVWRNATMIRPMWEGTLPTTHKRGSGTERPSRVDATHTLTQMQARFFCALMTLTRPYDGE